ncbi:MAG: polyisoprenoid-binding protein YceI [Cyclobacteriaceae bacterium]|jgi:polyisoprenoid-binding protein YceI
MLQTIIFSIALLFSGGDKVITYNADTSASTITWIGKKVTGEHNGAINLKDASFDLKEGVLVGGNFTIDMATMVSLDLEGEWKQKLEGHLKSDDFFGVEKFPTATFVITRSVPKGPGKYKVVGDITIKGVTEQIQFPVDVTEENGQITGTAKVTIDRSKFNVRYGSGSFFDNLGDKTIYDDFELSIKIVVNK